MNRTYAWRGGHERLRTQGELLASKVLILPALFDEANRMRRFTVQLMAALVERGVGALLPDLPGTGESLVAIEELDWTDWLNAVADLRALLPEETKLAVAIRGGSLLDHAGTVYGRADRAWRLSPESGERILRMLDRTNKLSGGKERGYPLSASFRRGLADAVPIAGAEMRDVRLADEPGDARKRLTGRPLWRSAEPDEDDRLVAEAADDITAWVRAR